MKKIIFNISIFLFTYIIINSVASAQDMKSLRGETMGNKYKVTWLETKISAKRMADIRSQIEQRLDDVNQSMSTWRKDSEINKINNSPKATPIRISYDMNHVITNAIHVAQLTNNALDITVGPLVNLWGFGPDGQVTELPSEQAIEAAIKSTGISNITLKNQYLTKNAANLKIDLSAIAKGYGVDVVADVLERNDIHDYLVDIGGELRIKGLNASQQAWKVGVDKPFAYSTGQMEIITPGDSAVATSGNYRKYFEKNGHYYSHLIDPRTGKPVSHTVVSVTVIEKNSMTADALATAFMVLTVEESLAVANEHNIPIMIIEDKFGELITHHSESFEKYIKE
ncbi:FAD:protein FMN transferase [Shewanella sp. 10N.286.51.B2]|uniref:FAD:protein FMN transferase n=1 Tax=Shewanella sp. 10N.286.51.B2 TaxID=3229707 RepID=UPI00354D281F